MDMDMNLIPNNADDPDFPHPVVRWLRQAKKMPSKVVGDPGAEVHITAEHWRLCRIAEALAHSNSTYDGEMSLQTAGKYLEDGYNFANPSNSPLGTQVRAMCTAYDALDLGKQQDVGSFVHDDPDDEHDEMDEVD
jgi:hypothetical protein